MKVISRRAFLAALALIAAQTATAAPTCADLFKPTFTVEKSKTRWQGGLANNPRAIIISAPSGGGKTTLMNLLVKEFPDDFKFSVSTTTRAPRGTEQNGKDYHFTDVTNFQSRIASGDFLEFAQVHGNYYGTARSTVEGTLASGQSSLLLIDIKGAEVVRQSMPGRTLSIFISPPSMEVLEKRLRERKTDSEEAIQKRLKNARDEMKEASKFDVVIVNDDLEKAYGDLKAALQSVK